MVLLGALACFGPSGCGWAMPPIPARAERSHTQCMTQLLLAYERPAGLTEHDFRSWLLSCTTMLATRSASLAVEPGTLGGRSALRLSIDADRRSTSTQDTIAGLLGDMRMLGLRPEVIAADTTGQWR
jgi:hypothetical protein